MGTARASASRAAEVSVSWVELNSLEFGTFRTAERCWEISQGYAFFAYPWNTSTLWNPHPERVSRTPRTPAGGAILGASQYQGYAKNAYPWLISQHRSAVPKRLSFSNTECTPKMSKLQ